MPHRVKVVVEVRDGPTGYWTVFQNLSFCNYIYFIFKRSCIVLFFIFVKINVLWEYTLTFISIYKINKIHSFPLHLHAFYLLVTNLKIFNICTGDPARALQSSFWSEFNVTTRRVFVTICYNILHNKMTIYAITFLICSLHYFYIAIIKNKISTSCQIS